MGQRPGEPRSFQAVLPSELWIHLAVVACGSRLEETLVMLKSAVLFSHRKIQFHIFTEDSLKPEFDKQVNLQKLWHSVLLSTNTLPFRNCMFY
ncbi:Glucoside xylosyltransferase 2 [Saguinus oedipus]|uniref:Glucoside xylosyltransferase 2 n=1 Tax=Saguinus oedipus TaxID=9490 RepID=A0ABQ9U456_SAGOE|nr:Glucoside xylosyltransferase 2 [Saguinus oedipus]